VSGLSDLVRRGRRALRLPPRLVAHRLVEAAAKKARRPWDFVHPALVTERALLRATGARSVDALWTSRRRSPFFLGDPRATAQAFRARFPSGADAVMTRADRVLRHEFDLLGSGSVQFNGRLPWRTDFKSGREWPRQYGRSIEYAELGRPTDVKVPWELSRCQHMAPLGQAFWLTGEEWYAREFVTEVTDWIADNPYAYSVNWACAMDVALRAISWIWAFHFLSDADACADTRFRFALLKSLFLHGEFVAANLERGDVNGNHYLTDGVGLVFLGTLFHDTPAGRQWLQTGRAIVVDEMFEQVSVDGVDFEKSTAYHRLVLEAFLTAYLLLDRAGQRPPDPAWERLQRMCEFVEAYSRPDGLVPLVGDADDGRIQQLGSQPINDHRYLLSTAAAVFGRSDFKAASQRFHEESFWLLGPPGAARYDAVPETPLPVESRAFPAGGFYVLRTPRDHVFVDCGEVGMHGRGGHGHNDILSFTLVLDGARLITDCGAYLYTASVEWRNRFRSTEFHNVVQVDGEELNRFVSRDHLWTLHDDARPSDVEWRFGARADYFAGSHRGYGRLPDPVMCRREIVLDRSAHRVVVRDTLTAAAHHRYCWRFHFDPSVAASVVDGDVRLSGDRDAWLLPVTPIRPSLDEAWVSPSYGVKLRSSRAIFVETAATLSRAWVFSLDSIPSADRAPCVEAAFNLCVKSS
jgi:hypothetical protein